MQPVGVVAGETAGPDAALTVEPCMATHKYILGLLGYISGSVKLLVSQDGEVFLVSSWIDLDKHVIWKWEVQFKYFSLCVKFIIVIL